MSRMDTHMSPLQEGRPAAAPVRMGSGRALTRVWGVALHHVIVPVAMGLLFFLAVTPVGLLLRAVGKDSARRRRDPAAASYWIVRDPPGPAPDSMKNQF